jgi:hypothetical protein
VRRFYRELIERAREASARAESEGRRASDLRSFARALRNSEPPMLVRCAWCDRVAADGCWIEPDSLPGDNLREQLRDYASHGICPDCFARVSDEVASERARNSGLDKS